MSKRGDEGNPTLPSAVNQSRSLKLMLFHVNDSSETKVIKIFLLQCIENYFKNEFTKLESAKYRNKK